MKRYISSKAVCPFYRSESTSMIRCGRTETTVHRVFSNCAESKNYKKKFCKSDGFAKCKIYRLIEEESTFS